MRNSNSKMNVPLSQPDITDKEKTEVLEVLSTSDLSLGPKSKEFEEKFAGYAQRKYGVAVSSGTAGLHLIVRALGIGKGDEVITSPFSFISSAIGKSPSLYPNIFLYNGCK